MHLTFRNTLLQNAVKLYYKKDRPVWYFFFYGRQIKKMGMISKLIKTGLTLGAAYTAYQASQKTKRETGSLIGETFGRNFMSQAITNVRLLMGAAKERRNKKKRIKRR